MIVIPMKWVPWVLLIVGIYSFFTDTDPVACVVMTAIGGVWLYLRKKYSLEKGDSENSAVS